MRLTALANIVVVSIEKRTNCDYKTETNLLQIRSKRKRKLFF